MVLIGVTYCMYRPTEEAPLCDIFLFYRRGGGIAVSVALSDF